MAQSQFEKDKVMPFGKHKGTPLVDVDKDYLQYMSGTMQTTKETEEKAGKEYKWEWLLTMMYGVLDGEDLDSIPPPQLRPESAPDNTVAALSVELTNRGLDFIAYIYQQGYDSGYATAKNSKLDPNVPF
jgi:hypothetical protein